MTYIEHVDNDLPTDDDIMDIENTLCLNCCLPYDPAADRILFTRLRTGEIIWWHRQTHKQPSCAATHPTPWKKHTPTSSTTQSPFNQPSL